MKLFRRSLVGSYPQPDPQMLSKRMPSAWLDEAQNEQERARLDVVTDGEIRRESYSNRFATALDGLDLDNPATITSRGGQSIPAPSVVDPIRRGHSVCG